VADEKEMIPSLIDHKLCMGDFACHQFRVLNREIADLDGIYDPVQYNDRLLLGLYVRYHQRPLSRARLAHPDTLSPSK